MKNFLFKLSNIKHKCMRIRFASKQSEALLAFCESYFSFFCLKHRKIYYTNKIDDFVFLYTSQYKLLFAYRIDVPLPSLDCKNFHKNLVFIGSDTFFKTWSQALRRLNSFEC